MKTIGFTLLAVVISFSAWLLLFGMGGSHATVEGLEMAKIRGLEIGASDYKADIGMNPPLQNTDFFRALNGQNRLNKLYMSTESWPHDDQGRVLDSSNHPYVIAVENGQIVVHSQGGDAGNKQGVSK